MIASLVSIAIAAPAYLDDSTKDRGYVVAKFSNAYGSVNVYLPNDISPGDAITGSVFVDSDSKQMEGVEAYLNDVPGVRLNRAGVWRKWIVPTTAKNGYPLVVRTKDGRQIGAMRIPISPDPGGLDAYTFPSFMQIGRPAVVWGPFGGDPTKTQLRNGDTSFSILAESMRSAVFYVPYDTKPGSVAMSLRQGEATMKAEPRAISVDLSSDKANLKEGEKTTVTVKVSGLKGLTEATLPFLRVENLTPGTLDMGGKEARTIIPKVSEDGTYRESFVATSVKAGGFLLTTYVEPGPGIVVVPPGAF
ncbi:MAG: hypothetical protein GC165_13810 [Armatimonadetes bacterium]|nr:hypothetical protein [Armatimonadota bacterium]